MQVEFGGMAINGGWLVFAALVAVWVGLVVENRTKRLSALLASALDETNELRPRQARRGKVEPPKDSVGLAHLAAAVEQERQAGELEREPARESNDRA